MLRSIALVILATSLLMSLMLFLSTACMPPPTYVELSPTATRGVRIPPAIYKNKIAFKSDRDGGEAIYIMNPDGSGQARLEDESLYYEALKLKPFSPDRSQMAFVRFLDGNYDIFVRDIRGNWTRQLVTGPAADYQPAWSPDGAHIAYVSEAEGVASIWVTDATGEESLRLTNPLQWKDKHPSWSSDGVHIVFWSDREGLMQIWLMDADGSNQRNVSQSQANDWDPVWIKPSLL
jgi:TolB protein